MATKTPNLNLIKPANGEFFNTWDQPTNVNSDLIDAAVGSLQTEVQAARGSQTNLQTRLANGMNADGTLLPAAEVVAARSSHVYNSDYGSPGFTSFQLNDRIQAGDFETWYARQGQAGLIDALAWGDDVYANNTVVIAPTNFLTCTGAVATVNGLASNIYANINGYIQKIRKNKSVTITGSSGTYYLYLQRNAAGETFITDNSGSVNNTTGVYTPNSKIQVFSANAIDFTDVANSGASAVKPGDILQITAPGGNLNLGNYVVLATHTEDSANLATNQLRVIGEFASISSGLSYSIVNPVSPTFGFTATAHSKTFARASGQIYIGRVVFNGTSVTSYTQYAVGGTYAAFTQITGNFNLTIQHNLGYFPSKVLFYGSQANDFSQPLDLLSVADISSGALQRSVIAQVTDTTISVKNTTTGVFYKDFGGTTQTAGYLYIVAER